MNSKTLLCTIDEKIATVTLNRPHVLNALNTEMFDELEQLFERLAADDGVRVILLTGAGEKAFAAGADIAELEGLDAAEGERKARRGQAVFSGIERCGKPVIALLNGFALGGGCELALSCTLRIASEAAKLGQPEVKLGILPGYGGTQRLPRLVGQAAALKLLMTGEMIGAAEALRIGLVNEVVSAEALLARGEELARMVVAAAPLAVTACLEAVRRGSQIEMEKALDIEAELFGRLCGTKDKAEGMAAFRQKRVPAWSDQRSLGESRSS
jgi:enoyl-CoA hydratase